MINEFAAAASDRLIQWSDAGVPSLGLGISWTEAAFNDASWPQALGGFGGASAPGIMTIVNMVATSYSLYIRKTFGVDAALALSTNDMELSVDFEEGFVAYLNGVEVARKGLGAPGGFCYHDQRANNNLQTPGTPSVFNLGPASRLLTTNANVLAITVHKYGLRDTNWRIVPALSVGATTLVASDDKWRYFIGRSEPLGGLSKPAPTATPLPDPEVVANQDEWHYMAGTNEPSNGTLAWTTPAFTPTGWSLGRGGFGFGDPGIATTINVINVALSFYLRKEFVVSAEQLDMAHQLMLSTLYDDGFAAYINGVEFARNNVGTQTFVACTTRATASHEASAIERFFAGDVAQYLHVGTNMLGIQVHNTSVGNGDLSMQADLEIIYEGRAYDDEDVADDYDWIELYNRGSAPVSLDNWTLSDDVAQPDKWRFPSGTVLGSNAYYLVMATGLNLAPTNASPHTNFKLSSKGEYLGLYDNLGQVRCAFAPAYPTQSVAYSLGRTGVGDEYAYLPYVTPGRENDTNDACAGLLPVPQADVPHGFYDAPISVVLSVDEPGAQIIWTTNGTVPTLSNGVVYAGPLALTQPTPLRARGFKPGYVPSEPFTATYLVGLTNALKTLPAICLVGDEERELFEPHGLMAISGGYSNWWPATEVDHYNNGTPTGRAYERSVSAEFVPLDGSAGFTLGAGLRTAGQGGRGSRRRGPNWAQQTYKYDLRLYFRSVYGQPELTYRLFPSSRVKELKQLAIKSGFWDDCINPALKDELFRRLMLDTGQLASHGRHANLFINGVFKSYYNLIERPKQDYFQRYFNSTNDWEVLKLGVTEGDATTWNSMVSFAKFAYNDPTNYTAYCWLADRLDVVNYADYLLVSVYSNNSDWPANNWIAAREHVAGAKFFYVPWDSGCSFGYNGAMTVTNNTFVRILSFVAGGAPYALYYNFLRGSPEFRLICADRVQKHFFNGGALTDENVSNHYAALKAGMFEPVRYQQRTYNNDVETNWLPKRRGIIFQHLKDEGYWPETSAPLFNRRGGTVTNGFEVILAHTNSSGVIYFTTDGSDPREAGSGNPIGRLYSAPVRVHQPVTIKARVCNAGEWSPLDEATFTVADYYQALRLTELMYHPLENESYEFIELLNSGTSTLAMAGVRFSEGIEYTFPTGVTLAAGSYLVLAADQAAFTSRYPDVAVAGVYTGRLNNAGETVTLVDPQGSNIIACTYSDEWYPSTDGSGYSLVPLLPDGDPSLAASWRPSTYVHGSPGAEDPLTYVGPVIISEFMYHPAAPDEEFIELYNMTNLPIALHHASSLTTTWQLSDDTAVMFVLPEGIALGPNECLVIVGQGVDPAAFRARCNIPANVPVLGPCTRGLGNKNDAVRVWRPQDLTGTYVLVDQVFYSDAAPWPTEADGGGPSLERSIPFAFGNVASSWHASSNVGGTPGRVVPEPSSMVLCLTAFAALARQRARRACAARARANAGAICS